MKTKHILPVLIIMLSAYACSYEYDLNESVFIPDKLYPSLPAYTEWGYNTFGALYDRKPLISTDPGVPFKVISTGGKTTFSFKGYFNNDDYYYSRYYDDETVTLIFDLYSFLPESLSDLLTLDNTAFDLTDSLCDIRMYHGTTENDVSVISGTLYFKRAQNLLVDKVGYEVILSGTFEFQALIDGEPTSISAGRFDMGISDNLYIY